MTKTDTAKPFLQRVGGGAIPTKPSRNPITSEPKVPKVNTK